MSPIKKSESHVPTRRRIRIRYEFRELFPGYLELREFRKKFAAVEKARDDLGVAQRPCERIVWHRLLRDAAVDQYLVEVERGVLFDLVCGRLEASLHHVHVAKGVDVDGAIRKS